MAYNGIINVYKEKGFTSHDVVAKLRGICKQKKIGHTGTLDPEAEGVLPVCLGNGTKLCDMLADRDKEYVAELLLGIVTDTQDVTGQVLSEQPVEVTEAQLREAVAEFQGGYMQVPPMYSALKVNGRRLYELARAGREVERQPRPVKLYEIQVLEMHLPVVKLRVACSKGTYIRTLCADIGERLGCGGTMKSLVRTRVGSFCVEDAVTLSQLEKLAADGRIEEKLWAVDALFEDFPCLHIRPAFLKLIENGNAFLANQTEEDQTFAAGQWVRVYGEDRFFGIYAYETEKGRYQPVKMFL